MQCPLTYGVRALLLVGYFAKAPVQYNGVEYGSHHLTHMLGLHRKVDHVRPHIHP